MDTENDLLNAGPAPEVPASITKNAVIRLVFAIASLALMYVFTCLVPISGAPLGFFLVCCALFLGTMAAAFIFGGKLCLSSVFALLIGLGAAFTRVINGSFEFELYPVFTVVSLAYGYFVLSLYSNHSRSLSGSFLLDIFKGIAYMFMSISAFFVSLFRPEGAKRGGRSLLIVCAALIITLLLVVAVASLLSYDAHFAGMLPEISIADFSRSVFRLSFAVPLAACAFSSVVSSKKRLLPSFSTPENAERAGEKLRVLPSLLTALPIVGVLVIYVMFFCSQWAYYMSAFTHTLPAGYSAAEYARDGFFSLLIVALINAALIVVLTVFTKNSTKGAEITSRVLVIALSAATLVLIATAISKMLLYIDRFDLTRARLIATLILILLAIGFVCAVISAVCRRFKVLPAFIAASLVFLFAFCVLPVNRFIAKYNVDMYLNGKHDSVDVAYLARDLGWAAVPELARLNREAQDRDIREKTREEMTNLRYRMDIEWYESSIPYPEAKKLLSGGSRD